MGDNVMQESFVSPVWSQPRLILCRLYRHVYREQPIGFGMFSWRGLATSLLRSNGWSPLLVQ